MSENAERRRVVLTPLRIETEGTEVLCIAVRSPATEEITALTLSPRELCQKAGIPLARALEIFEAAVRANARKRADEGR